MLLPYQEQNIHFLFQGCIRILLLSLSVSLLHAQVRLRPILMTVLTMIFGMLPLMFSSGAGANGNSSLGTGVVGGMAVGTLALLFVVPVFYIIFEFLQEKIRKPMEEEPDVQVLLEKEKSEVERERK